MPAIPPDLYKTCAPNVATVTMQDIVHVESGGNTFVINAGGTPMHFTTAKDAIAETKKEQAAGVNVAMGLMQVTIKTAERYGYSIDQMFDACTNLQAGARVITDNYKAAKQIHGNEQEALKAALSAYNTGNFTAGFNNGYVALYYGPQAGHASTGATTKPTTKAAINPYTVRSTVYIQQEQETQHGDTSKPGI